MKSFRRKTLRNRNLYQSYLECNNFSVVAKKYRITRQTARKIYLNELKRINSQAVDN